MARKPRIPMLPTELPQQRLYLVEGCLSGRRTGRSRSVREPKGWRRLQFRDRPTTSPRWSGLVADARSPLAELFPRTVETHTGE